MYVQIDSIPL